MVTRRAALGGDIPDGERDTQMTRFRSACAGLTAVATAVVLAGCGASAAFSAHPAWLAAQAPAAAKPAYFIDNDAWSGAGGYEWSDFTIRRTADGTPVTVPDGHLDHQVTAVTAIGTGRGFILAEEAPLNCATQLYWFRLGSQGSVSTMSAVGAQFSGEVNSLAASADGRTIAYTVSGCTSDNNGFLKVLDVRTGQTRAWKSVNLTGRGRIALASNLALSANGKLLAFVGWTAGPPRASVRLVATSGPVGDPAGDLAQHSKVIRWLPLPPQAPRPQDAVAISPAGTSFYLCTVTAEAGAQVTSIAAYSTRTGQLMRPVTQLRAPDPANGHPLPGCAMSVSQGGRFALVPYAVRYPDPASASAVLSVASIDLTAAVPPATFSFPVRQDPDIAGPGAAGVSVTW
jgi:hypothetical protein